MIGNDISGQDCAGLLMGDVSGNWGQAGMRMSTLNAVAADSGISLEVSGVSTGLVSVSVYVEPSSAEPISAVELSLSLSEGARLNDARVSSTLRGWQAPVVSGSSSQVNLTSVTDVSNAITAKTRLLELVFAVADQDQSILGFSGWLNESTFSVAETLWLSMPVDSDGDGIYDRDDAFPNDPAASVDTDGDGMPDDWNLGYTAEDSTTGLVLDLDDDNDGFTDLEELDARSDEI